MSAYAPPPREAVISALHDWTGDESVIYGAFPAGDDDIFWYYLAVWTDPHNVDPEVTLLKIRYLQWPKPNADDKYEPTLKKNGMAIRDEGGNDVKLASVLLGKAFAQYADAARVGDPPVVDDGPVWYESAMDLNPNHLGPQEMTFDGEQSL